jgi:hypothetical protein
MKPVLFSALHFTEGRTASKKKKCEKKFLSLNMLKSDKFSPESLTPLEYINAPRKALAVDVITDVKKKGTSIKTSKFGENAHGFGPSFCSVLGKG